MTSRSRLIVVMLAAAALFAYAVAAETPVGALQGRVTAADTGQALAGIWVHARPRVPMTGSDSQRTRTRADGSFRIARLPAGDYEVQPATNVYDNDAVSLSVVEGRVASAEMRLEPNDPFLNLNIHQHNYLPTEEPKVSLHGFRQGDEVKMQLFAVDTDTLLRDHGHELRDLLDPVSDSNEPGHFKKLRRTGLRPVHAWTHRIIERDAEGVFYNTLRLDRRKPGVYLLSAQGEKKEALGWLTVTDLALVTKTAENQVLAYTVDLVHGKPVPGVQVQLFANKASIRSAVTDGKGLAELRVPGNDELIAVGRRGDSIAYLRMYRYGNDTPQKYRVYTYTDRPVYRPGHHVWFKGIARRMQGTGYVAPAARSADVEITDVQGTTIWEGSVDLNAGGSFHGELDLPSEVRSGTYSLTVRIDGERHDDSFAVASYRKPEWKVEIATPKPRYVRGDTVPVTLSAHYYFGSPVVEGKVRYTVFRSPYWRGWFGEELEELDEDSEFYDSGGEVVAEGELITDSGGAAHFEFPTAIDKNDDHYSDYQYEISAEVTDASDRMASGSGRVIVSRGEISMRAHPVRYVVAPGEASEVVAQVTDLNEKPVAGTAVSAVASIEVGDGKQARKHWVADQKLTSDDKGEVRIPVKPDRTGLVQVSFTTKDSRGNAVEASTEIWCSTAEGADEGPHRASLSVIPDRKLYHIGDTAQLLINAGEPGSTALLTIEAERILKVLQVPLTRKSTVVRLPVTRELEPNVFVNVCFVRKKEFVSSDARLNVNTDAHRLKVTVESDRETYRPRETATFRIRTTNDAGKPVSAECSFGLVDEAVYAIKEDSPKALWRAFYPRRQNSVNTEYSFPTVYLGDAGKDGSGETVRKEFPDTVAWEPVVRTDRSGQATVTVPLKDSLTTWRATVLAHTDATEVGRATDTILTTRELVLRLQTPRVFTEGDRLTVSAVAHNYTPSAQEVSVELTVGSRQSAVGSRQSSVAGVKILGDARKRVQVEPGESERVEWEIEATSAGTATLTAVANAGRFSDGMELKVPVRPFVREQVVYRAGSVAEQAANEEFRIDGDAIGGGLELRLSPSLGGALIGALDYLATYPYGCTEQTLSSFLPNLAIQGTLKRLDVRRPELEQKLPAMVQAGLIRLYNYQHDDGGWGWWEYDKSDPWMTAYVLIGLQMAREAGYEINDQIYANGLRHATDMAASTQIGPNEGMLLAYALVRGKAVQAARPLLNRIPDSTKRRAQEMLRFRSLGYALLALEGTGRPEDRRLAERLMADAWTKAVTQNGLAHWEEQRLNEWDWDAPQDVESTAVMMQAALELTPDHLQLPNVARWLLLKRNGPRWQSTRDTAWIILAMGRYLESRSELRPSYKLNVLLNGKEVHAGEVSPGDALGETVVKLPVTALQPDNRVEIRKDGEGSLYYALQVTTQVRAPSFAPESTVAGLTIQREYFRLTSRKDGQGRISVVPDGKEVRSMKVGDRLLVRLTLRTEHRLDYLMVEDPLPAGFEVQDRGEVERYDWGYWWSHHDFRDDRASFFIRSMEKGKHTIEYYVRPEMAGRIRLLPAVLSDMYIPSTRASTADATLEVKR